MGKTVPVYTAPVDRYLTDWWGLFPEQPVTDVGGAGGTTNLLTRTVDQGGALAVARATGAGVPGNDRRLFLLDESFQATDVEAHLTVSGIGTGPTLQVGVVVRVKPGGVGLVAPLVWTNVFFGTSGTLLPGAWEFRADGGSTSFQINQQTSPAPFFGYPRRILSATGDGTTATVTMAERHFLEVSAAIVISGNVLFPGNPLLFVAQSDVLDPFSFRVPHATVGTQPGGDVQWPFWPNVYRTLAVRLVGTTLTAKQWPTDHAPEPSWSDTVKTGSVVMPGTLTGGVPFPSGAGRAGFLLAHMGGAPARADVRKFEAVRLA